MEVTLNPSVNALGPVPFTATGVITGFRRAPGAAEYSTAIVCVQRAVSEGPSAAPSSYLEVPLSDLKVKPQVLPVKRGEMKEFNTLNVLFCALYLRLPLRL